ncbi:hypothetical protein [Aeromicrobium sp. IC_218]|uniref:hypothetical protein n=1 Tax=Aeromicrobium sp. IC_218 TaxID=2545468 RepID=UPI00103B4EB6|nr:hypothetical protein [Aeromicrobium sp. IC_218]TCI99202.1 hypothetical protein E0W78_08380 [Aeromicrobium sp. IC_218]
MRGKRSRGRALALAVVSAVVLGCALAGIAVAAVVVGCPGCTDEPAAAATTEAPLDAGTAAAVERLGAPFPASVDARAVVDEVERRHSIDPEPYLQWGSADEELRLRWQCAWEAEVLAAESDGDGPRLRSAIDQLDVAQRAEQDAVDPAWFAEVVAPARDGLVAPLAEHVETGCPSPVG